MALRSIYRTFRTWSPARSSGAPSCCRSCWRRGTVSTRQFYSGVVLILVGYFKKIAIADGVGPTVDHIFTNPDLAGSQHLLLEGLYLFAIQIYCDFSGYTDIARGVSRLMGIELRLNFRQPYLSANITEFWRRWHISLSDWLRDYVYISLGGNRLGAVEDLPQPDAHDAARGTLAWAGWNFIVWGALHGVFLSIHRAWSGRAGRGELGRKPTTVVGWLGYVASTVLTFHLVCLTWIFFRAPPDNRRDLPARAVPAIDRPGPGRPARDLGVVHIVARHPRMVP